MSELGYVIQELDSEGNVINVINGSEEWASQTLTYWRRLDLLRTEEPVKPEIVVTNLQVDPAYAALAIIEEDLHSVTLPVGATLTVTAELRVGGQVVPHNGMFRMPLVSLDNRIRVLGVTFVDGVAVFSAVMTDSRIYHVKEEHVNQNLPPEEHMKFKGFWVYALEAT